jgi:hypothetical protein
MAGWQKDPFSDDGLAHPTGMYAGKSRAGTNCGQHSTVMGNTSAAPAKPVVPKKITPAPHVGGPVPAGIAYMPGRGQSAAYSKLSADTWARLGVKVAQAPPRAQEEPPPRTTRPPVPSPNRPSLTPGGLIPRGDGSDGSVVNDQTVPTLDSYAIRSSTMTPFPTQQEQPGAAPKTANDWLTASIMHKAARLKRAIEEMDKISDCGVSHSKAPKVLERGSKLIKMIK